MSQLIIYSPAELKSTIGDDEGAVLVSLADFGHIPYGHTIVGQVVFLEENADGCEDFGESLRGYDDPNPIVIVERGNCTFVQKVRNVEHGGGKMAIIVDELDNENVKYVVMVDDGTGNGIFIPSAMMNKGPGNKIIEYFRNNNEEHTKQVKFVMGFKINNPDNHVEYDLLLSTYQDRALDFVSEFKPYHERLGKSVTMTPHYFSWPCFGCDDEIKKQDCYGNGKYCAVDYQDLMINGTQILDSNIRQKCVYKYSIEKTGSDSLWWNYVNKAHSFCYKDFTEDCSKAVHSRVGISWKDTQKCLENSFTNKGTADEDNTILGEDYEYWVEGGFSFTPAVIINDVRYKGDMAPDFVYEAICSGFNTPPDVCKSSLLYEESIGSKHVTFNWFLFITIILVILNIILAAICIRRNKTQLKTHVFSALGKYTKLDRGRNSDVTQ